jgi:hypothetical protein
MRPSLLYKKIHQMNEGILIFEEMSSLVLCAQKFVPTLMLFREIIGQFSKNYHQ